MCRLKHNLIPDSPVTVLLQHTAHSTQHTAHSTKKEQGKIRLLILLSFYSSPFLPHRFPSYNTGALHRSLWIILCSLREKSMVAGNHSSLLTYLTGQFVLEDIFSVAILKFPIHLQIFNPFKFKNL